MYRGKVTAVDASGAYVQTADFGVLGPCQWANSRPVVGASVLVADVGSESQPDLIVVGAIGTTAGAVVSAELSNNADVNLQTAGVNRWTFRKSADAESGGNTGSNLAIVRRSDAGSQLSLALTFWRATGKITVGDVGATAGLEMGASGPRMMVGTGGPSGISAPVGSTWRQTDANASHGSLTGLLWTRVTGPGTDAEGTDWLVDYEGRWVDYTPNVYTWTKGSSTVTGRYTRRGKTITGGVRFDVDTGGGFAVGKWLVLTLPATAASPCFAHGTARLVGTSTYVGTSEIASGGGAVTLRAINAASASTAQLNMSSTVPFTWATGHYLLASFTYEAA